MRTVPELTAAYRVEVVLADLIVACSQVAAAVGDAIDTAGHFAVEPGSGMNSQVGNLLVDRLSVRTVLEPAAAHLVVDGQADLVVACFQVVAAVENAVDTAGHSEAVDAAGHP